MKDFKDTGSYVYYTEDKKYIINATKIKKITPHKQKNQILYEVTVCEISSGSKLTNMQYLKLDKIQYTSLPHKLKILYVKTYMAYTDEHIKMIISLINRLIIKLR